MPSFVGYAPKSKSFSSKAMVEAVQNARTKLKYGQDYRTTEREAKWRQSEDQYRGEHWKEVGIEDDRADLISVNMSFCVDPKTEILTQRGWLRYDELAVTDLALTYNVEEGFSEWQPVSAVNVFEGEYRMLSMESQSHSSLTTDNHMWPADRYGRRLLVRSDEIGSHDRLVVTAPRHDLPSEGSYPDAIVELVAWFWTEGHIPMSGTFNRFPGRAINITQSHEVNPDHVESIRLAFKAMWGDPTDGRLRPNVGPRWNERRNGENTVFWTNADAGDLFQALAPNKVPTYDFILSLTPHQLERFLGVSMDGDGSEGRTMVQASLARAESFQFAALQAGIASTIRQTAPPKKLTHNQAYSVSLRKNSHFTPGQTRKGMEWVDYDGVVWCPTTPNGTFMARRNGFTFFTGNSTVNTIVPYVTGSNPHFLLSPFSGDATLKNARIQEAFLNNLWTAPDISGQEHLATATIDALIYGDGYGKIGFDIETRRVPGADALSADTAEIGKVWAARVDPWDVWMDPTSDGVHNARWVCQRSRMTRTELEESTKYKNVGEDNVTYSTTKTLMDDGRRRSGVADEVFDGSEYAEVYEFWDLVAKRLIVFADGSRPLLWVDDIGGLPIVQQGNYRIPNSPYHMGELETLWPLQQELNKTRSQMITHRKRGAQKYLARRAALDDEAITALRSGVVNDVAFVNGDQQLEDIVRAIPMSPLSADLYNMSDVIKNDIYEISGVNEYLRGATPSIRRTATEATIIEGASNVKSQHKLRQVEKMAARMGELILKIAADVFAETDYDEIQLYLTGRDAEAVTRAQHQESVADLIGGGLARPDAEAQVGAYDPQQDVVIEPSPDIFVGQYRVDVEQASTELRNPVLREQKYREMSAMLLQMTPTLGQMGIQINLKKVLELWFDAAGIDDVDAMFGGEDPMAALQAMLGGAGGGEIGGTEPQPGAPNQAAAVAPTDPFSDQNTGALPPEE